MTNSLPYKILREGDHAPWFEEQTLGGSSFHFDIAAGRYVLLCFFGSASVPMAASALQAVSRHAHLFDDERLCFFGVTCDPADALNRRIAESYPGIRFFLDYSGKVSQLYGAVPEEATQSSSVPVRCLWVLIDPTLRIEKIWTLEETGATHQAVFEKLATLPKPGFHAGFEVHAPILILPNVFDSGFCNDLMDLYDRNGGEDTGFMTSVNGKTVGKLDFNHKRRKDFLIEDPEWIRLTQKWVQRRVIPEIKKVHHFEVTRMERYLIGCYAAEDGGHFRAHRDNTTAGTAHRRFAVSINLNDDFDGGEVSFPEYGSRSYKAPAGGAVVFSCSLLHAVSKVTRGRRYAFLPFLYDEAASQIREKNNALLDEAVEAYDPNKALV